MTKTRSASPADGPAAPPPRQGRRAKGTGTTYVYQRLREGILSLDYVPGANLDEARLVESFGLSRTPVREALIRLAADGLVVLLPDRGAQVEPVDLADFPRYVEAFDLVQRAVTRDAGPSGVCRNTPGGPIWPTREAGRFWAPPAALVA